MDLQSSQRLGSHTSFRLPSIHPANGCTWDLRVFNGSLIAVNLADGKRAWSARLPSHARRRWERTHGIYRLHGRFGTRGSSERFAQMVVPNGWVFRFWFPSVDGNGTISFGDSDGALYALP